MIKIALNRWSFPQEYSLENCIKISKQHGLEGIEVNVEEDGDLTVGTTSDQLKYIKDVFDKQNFSISSVNTLLLWKYPVTSDDPVKSEKGKTIFRRMIDFAHAFDVKVILIVPGVVHADPPLNFDNPHVSYKKVYERAFRYILEMSDYAGDKNVTIGLENVYYNKFLLSPVEFEKFLTDINRENVKWYFDPGNTMLAGFPDDWIEYLGKRICSIHVKDHDPHIKNIYGVKNIFGGEIDWAAVARLLHQYNYSGFLVGEPSLAPYRYFPDELVKYTGSALQLFRSMIENGGAV